MAEVIIWKRLCLTSSLSSVGVFPSHMSGDVVLVQAKKKGAGNSEFHEPRDGAGDVVKATARLADAYDFAGLRKSILIPSGVEDASLRTDGPFAYRDLDDCMNLIQDYVDVVLRFGVVGYMGHL